MRDYARPLSLAAFQLSLSSIERPQALLPFALEATRHQPVVGVDGAVAALGALRFVGCSLHPEPPLLQGDSRSLSSRSAAPRVAASPAGSRAAMNAYVTASSIWMPPILRQ